MLWNHRWRIVRVLGDVCAWVLKRERLEKIHKESTSQTPPPTRKAPHWKKQETICHAALAMSSVMTGLFQDFQWSHVFSFFFFGPRCSRWWRYRNGFQFKLLNIRLQRRWIYPENLHKPLILHFVIRWPQTCRTTCSDSFPTTDPAICPTFDFLFDFFFFFQTNWARSKSKCLTVRLGVRTWLVTAVQTYGIYTSIYFNIPSLTPSSPPPKSTATADAVKKSHVTM